MNVRIPAHAVEDAQRVDIDDGNFALCLIVKCGGHVRREQRNVQFAGD